MRRSLLKLSLPAGGRKGLSRTMPMQGLCGRSAATASDSCMPATASMDCMFGRKYYGRPLHEVVSKDPGYCRWMLGKAEEDGAPPGLLENAAWLSQHAPLLKVPRELVEGGKHRGRRLSELVHEDPLYCQWILRQAKAGDAVPSVRERASWLEQHAPHLKEDQPVPGFLSGGKHHGRALSDVVAQDPAYCQWILREAEAVRPSEAVREAADWLMKNVPNLKQELGVLASGGKHRNRPMSEVAVQDPAYCQWVLRECQEKEACSELRHMAGWLMKNAPHLKDDKHVYASGGKHQGRLMSEVVVEDPAYCQWIIRKVEDGCKSAALCEKASWLKENAPHLKERPTARGKQHGGRCLHDLVAEDPSYCQWLLRTSGRHRQRTPWSSSTSARCRGSVLVPVGHGAAQGLQQGDWFRQNVPELLETSKVDLPAFDRIGRNFFEQYGDIFVVRRGPHRLKTFRRVLEEAPEFVKRAEKRVEREPDGKGYRFKNSYFLAAFAKRSSKCGVFKNSYFLAAFAKRSCRQEQSAATSSERRSAISGASEASHKTESQLSHKLRFALMAANASGRLDVVACSWPGVYSEVFVLSKRQQFAPTHTSWTAENAACRGSRGEARSHGADCEKNHLFHAPRDKLCRLYSTRSSERPGNHCGNYADRFASDAWLLSHKMPSPLVTTCCAKSESRIPEIPGPDDA
eukprot:s6060_g3.t1